MHIVDTKLEGCKVITPARYADDRGFFSESWNQQQLAAAGIEMTFVQDNHSYSERRGTVRGLHYQAPPHAQDKLVRVVVGSILDVAVDVRKGSSTFGEWVSEELSAENGRQLLVPKGFLHGFVTCEDGVHVLYKCTDVYAPECDGAVRFDDPVLKIDWKLQQSAVLSEKDDRAPSFSEFKSPF